MKKLFITGSAIILTLSSIFTIPVSLIMSGLTAAYTSYAWGFASLFFVAMGIIGCWLCNHNDCLLPKYDLGDD